MIQVNKGMMSDRHTFALFVPQLDHVLQKPTPEGSTLVLKDKELWLRLSTVLRLRDGDLVIFFDTNHNALCRIDTESLAVKNTVTTVIESLGTNKAQNPSLVLYQGLTKKSVFEEIVYNAAQLGVTTIVPVITTKTHKPWNVEHERARLQNIMIAACEQSKNFVLPALAAPLKLESIGAHLNTTYQSILLDPQGPLLTHTLAANKHLPTGFNLFIGAEGGLTTTEHTNLITTHGFAPHRLCESILRSQDATVVTLGIVRSF